MNLRVWLYFFKQAVTNIINNRLLHALGLGTMAVSLLIFGAFLLLFVNFSSWIQGWSHSLSMTVYLQEGTSDTKREKIAEFIRALPGTEIKQFISKEMAMKSLRSALGSQAGLLDNLDNPLPASFEIIFEESAVQRSDLKVMKEKVEKIEGVDEVLYSEQWLNQVNSLIEVIRLIGFIVGGLLCLGVLFIVTNTIKLTIYSRQEEIEVMKMVGASDWFVKAPFLMEGIIQGIFSGVIALLVLFSAYMLFCTEKMQLLDFAVLDFAFLPSGYIITILLLSMFLGFIGSFIAVGRFFDI